VAQILCLFLGNDCSLVLLFSVLLLVSGLFWFIGWLSSDYGHNEAFGRCWVLWETADCSVYLSLPLWKSWRYFMKFVSIYSMSLF